MPSILWVLLSQQKGVLDMAMTMSLDHGAWHGLSWLLATPSLRNQAEPTCTQVASMEPSTCAPFPGFRGWGSNRTYGASMHVTAKQPRDHTKRVALRPCPWPALGGATKHTWVKARKGVTRPRGHCSIYFCAFLRGEHNEKAKA